VGRPIRARSASGIGHYCFTNDPIGPPDGWIEERGQRWIIRYDQFDQWVCSGEEHQHNFNQLDPSNLCVEHGSGHAGTQAWWTHQLVACPKSLDSRNLLILQREFHILGPQLTGGKLPHLTIEFSLDFLAVLRHSNCVQWTGCHVLGLWTVHALALLLP